MVNWVERLDKELISYETNPVVYSTFKGIGSPFSLVAGRISSVARIEANIIKMISNARNLPGHILYHAS